MGGASEEPPLGPFELSLCRSETEGHPALKQSSFRCIGVGGCF